MIIQHCFTLLLLSFCLAIYGENLRVCYYPNWSQYRQDFAKYSFEHVDPFLCTHIVYSFPSMDAITFEVSYAEWNGQEQIAGLVALKTQNPALKVMMAIGGWNAGTGRFEKMSSTADNRATFISSAIAFMKANELDGLDMDWEYPSQEYKDRFTDLMRELRESFGDQYLLSIAMGVGADKLKNNYDLENLHQYLDWFGLMAYDLAGAWDKKTGYHTGLYPNGGSDTLNLDWAVNEFLSRGVPASKVVLGLASYGRSFTHAATYGSNPPLGTVATAGVAGPNTEAAGVLAYYEICMMVNAGTMTEMYDEPVHVAYAYGGDQFVSYDNKRSIIAKSEYALEKNLAGVMVWDLSMDDFLNKCGHGNSPLLTAAKAVMTGDDPESPSFTPYPIPTDPPTVTMAPGCEFTCPENGNDYYRDPCSCTDYYDCRTAQTFRKSCLYGLYWNMDANICDYAYNVECTASVENPETIPPRRTTTTTAATTTTRSSGATSSGSDVACEFQCGDRIGFYAHPCVCEGYILCQRDSQTQHQCQHDWQFNGIGCVFPGLVDCARSDRNAVDGSQQFLISSGATKPTWTILNESEALVLAVLTYGFGKMY